MPDLNVLTEELHEALSQKTRPQRGFVTYVLRGCQGQVCNGKIRPFTPIRNILFNMCFFGGAFELKIGYIHN